MPFNHNFKGIEIGCGDGFFLIPLESELRKSNNNFKLTGYDISPYSVQMARKRISSSNSHISFHTGTAKDIKERVDYLFIMDVLEHVENPYQFLRELKGKSDYMFVHLPLEHSWAHILLGKPRKSYKRFRHVHFFSWETARILFQECNLSIISYQFTAATRESLQLPGAFITKILRYIRYWAYKLLPLLSVPIAGGSVMIVIKDNDV